MQHVRIGEHHVGPLPDGFARVLRRVAVIGEGADRRSHRIHRTLEFVQLIFRQRLGRKQVHGAGAVVGQQPVGHRQVVAKRLAAGGGRHHHHVLAGFERGESLRLVGVEARDAACFERLAQGGVDGRRQVGVHALRGRLVVDGADGRFGIGVRRLEPRDHRIERLLRRQRQFLRELGKSQRQAHRFSIRRSVRLRLFFSTIHRKHSRNNTGKKCFEFPQNCR